MNLWSKLSKKHKYFIYSLFLMGFLGYYPYTSGFTSWLVIFTAFILVLVFTFLIHPKVTLREYLFVSLPPLHLTAGAALSLYYFPNLGLPTRTIALLGMGAVLYSISLVNNVFLVVGTREKMIPLYRVAVTWSQILLVVITISYFAGIFKIPSNFLVQNGIVAISTFLFSMYLFWALSLEESVVNIGMGEQVMLSLVGSFLIFILGLSVSFFPTESFLRSLFVSSVFMSVLGYLQSHVRNVVTKKLVLEYFAISFVFFILLLVFTP